MLLTWLDTHGTAVQAVVAVVGLFITAALVLITWWYVHLTDEISRTAQLQFQLSQRQIKLAYLQFQAAYLPTLHMTMRFDRDQPGLIGYRVVNIGQREVQIHSAKLWIRTDNGYWESVLEEYEGGILRPSVLPDAGVDMHFVWVDKSVMPEMSIREIAEA